MLIPEIEASADLLININELSAVSNFTDIHLLKLKQR